MPITHLSDDPDVRESQAEQMRDEIAVQLKFGDERERFLQEEQEKRDSFGVAQESEYWQWMFNQYIRYVLGVAGPTGGLGNRHRTGSTRKSGSHSSGRHK